MSHRLRGDSYQKVNCTKYISVAQQVELPKDTEGGAGFRRHNKENSVGSLYAFSMREGDITSRTKLPCFQFLFLSICGENRGFYLGQNGYKY